MRRRIAASFVALAPAACGADLSSEGTNTVAPLSAPVGIMVMEMGTGLHVMWQDTFTTETGFELQRRTDTGAFETLLQLPANSTERHDDTVTAGVTYVYRVRAIAGSTPGEWSSEATATAPTPAAQIPGPPSQLMAMRMGGGLHLMWNDNSSDETGFELQRKTDNTDFVTLSRVGVNVDNKMDSTCVAGTRYTYRVRALGVDDASDWSNEASATP
jgi:titin